MTQEFIDSTRKRMSPVGRSSRDDVYFSGWVEQNPDAVMITDETGIIEYVNPAFESLTGFARAEAVGRTPAILKSGTHDAEFYRDLWRTILAGRSFREIFVDRRKNGELFHAENLIWPVFGLISGSSSHKPTQMRAGQLLQRLYLAATARGLSLQPISQLLETAKVRATFSKLFRAGGVPLLPFRLGYADARLRPTPRRPAEDALRQPSDRASTTAAR